MKKTLLIPALLSIMLLSGCELSNYIIYNESSYEIIFKINNKEKEVLQSGKSVTYKFVDNYNIELEYFESSTPCRAEYKKNGDDIIFFDLTPIPVKIYNTLSIPVLLSAGGYLLNDPLSVQTGDNNTNEIFTRTPTLKVNTSSFPAMADFQIVNDVMYITVR